MYYITIHYSSFDPRFLGRDPLIILLTFEGGLRARLFVGARKRIKNWLGKERIFWGGADPSQRR